MQGLLEIKSDSAVPIWRQIEDGMQRLVVSGTLKPGEAVPSVRELARQIRVNPATVSKAYQRLVNAGALEVRRGEGTFVAERGPGHAAETRSNLLSNGAREYAELARSIRSSLTEATEALSNAWDALDGTPHGGTR